MTEQELQAAKERLKNAAAASPVSVDNDAGKVRMSCLSTTATAASAIHQHCYALHCSDTEYVGSPSQRETH